MQRMISSLENVQRHEGEGDTIAVNAFSLDCFVQTEVFSRSTIFLLGWIVHDFLLPFP